MEKLNFTYYLYHRKRYIIYTNDSVQLSYSSKAKAKNALKKMSIHCHHTVEDLRYRNKSLMSIYDQIKYMSPPIWWLLDCDKIIDSINLTWVNIYRRSSGQNGLHIVMNYVNRLIELSNEFLDKIELINRNINHRSIHVGGRNLRKDYINIECSFNNLNLFKDEQCNVIPFRVKSQEHDKHVQTKYQSQTSKNGVFKK